MTAGRTTKLKQLTTTTPVVIQHRTRTGSSRDCARSDRIVKKTPKQVEAETTQLKTALAQLHAGVFVLVEHLYL